MSRFAERLVRHLSLDDAELPRGMAWVYLACAVLSVPVFNRNLFQLAPAMWPQALVGHALPFLILPSLVHASYRSVMPGLLRRLLRPEAQVLAHLAIPALLALPVAALVAITFDAFGWRHASLAGLATMYVLLAWAFVLPAKLVVGWRKRADTNAELAARNELYAIQSRAHPHFLFNAINAVAALIHEDPVRAEEALVRFADVLRYVLETSTSPSIPLRRDLVILREYLEIQRVRFERLDYEIDVEPGLDDVETPPLVLLPLVENAVLHGVGGGGGAVRVRVRREAQALRLDVTDDGPGTSNLQGTGTALRDLGRRLELVYGEAASLVLGGSETRGFVATVRLPTRP